MPFLISQRTDETGVRKPPHKQRKKANLEIRTDQWSPEPRRETGFLEKLSRLCQSGVSELRRVIAAGTRHSCRQADPENTPLRPGDAGRGIDQYAERDHALDHRQSPPHTDIPIHKSYTVIQKLPGLCRLSFGSGMIILRGSEWIAWFAVELLQGGQEIFDPGVRDAIPERLALAAVGHQSVLTHFRQMLRES